MTDPISQLTPEAIAAVEAMRGGKKGKRDEVLELTIDVPGQDADQTLKIAVNPKSIKPGVISEISGKSADGSSYHLVINTVEKPTVSGSRNYRDESQGDLHIKGWVDSNVIGSVVLDFIGSDGKAQHLQMNFNQPQPVQSIRTQAHGRQR